MGSSFPLVLAGGPLRAWPAMLLVSSRLAGALAGRLGVTGTFGDPLLGLDPLDGRTDPVAIGPLSQRSQPFTWTKTPEEILGKTNRKSTSQTRH